MKTRNKSENRSWIQSKELRAVQVGLLLAVLLVQVHAAPGDLDTSFNANACFPGPISGGSHQSVSVLKPLNDGRILAGGMFNVPNSAQIAGIARLNPDGSLDESFLCSVLVAVYAIAVQPDGKILIGGSAIWTNGYPSYIYFARLQPDGALDPTFAAGSVNGNGVHALALQSDGKILLGGDFRQVSGVARTNLARLNPNGSVDSAFVARVGDSRSGYVSSLAVQNDGRILIGGAFASANGLARTDFARFNTDGTLDTSFRPIVNYWNQSPSGLAMQKDGKILIWGDWGTVNGAARKHFARLNSDGSLDTSFIADPTVMEFEPQSVALQSDGKILLGGAQATGGGGETRIGRLNANGSFDNAFATSVRGSGFGSQVLSLISLPDGRVLVGGWFTSVNRVTRTNVARLMGEYEPFAIIESPATQTAELGARVRFEIRVTGFPPPACQWFFNATNTLTAMTTNFSLELASVQPLHVGPYTAVVTNLFGAATSPPAMLNVIAAVERRPVPGINVFGDAGSLLNVQYADALSPAPAWLPLDTVSLTSAAQYCFDLTAPLPPQRFYRAWHTGTPAVLPSLGLNFVPAITLTGVIGSAVRVEGINQLGPTDAWFTLDTVTLTNTSQLYFDVTAPGQPQRLYRLVPLP